MNSTTANATSTLSPTIITPATVIQTYNSPCHTTTDSPPTDPPSFDSSPGFSYLCNDSPSSNHWLYGTHPDDPPTPYLNALTLAHAAHRDPDHQYLHHYDHAIASSVYMPTYTPATSPSFSIPSTLERYPGASIAARGNDVLTFIPVSVYANTNTEQTHTYAQLDNGSSINLIDFSFALRHNFTTRACKSLQVHGIGGVTTMTHEALVVLYFYGTPLPTDTTANISNSNISNSLAYKAVVIPFAINPTTMTIPLLIGSHVLSWLSTTPTNITGVAADSATILHHHNWRYRLQIPNLTSDAIRQIRHRTWSYDRMINYITTHSAITSPIPSPTPQPPYPPIPTPPPPPVSSPPPTDPVASPAPNSLPTNEANERERVRLEELNDQQFIPNYADLDQIIHNWYTAPEDDVPAELLRLCTNSAHELMPPGFPADYWPYVLDTDKPLLANRYNYFPPARRAEVFALFQSQLYPNICDKRPRQRPYCYGQALSYPQAFFHKDPDHPDRVSGFQMRCNTTHDRPIRSTRSQTYSPVQRRYLTVKTEELITKGYCERSDSAYRAPIMLVVKKTFLKDFMRLHGDSFFEK